MKDNFNRNINYLRISVTDRCNLRCRYCMPEDGVEMLSHGDILTFEEIVKVAEAAVAMGVDKIRITGGEPLVRKGIVDLVGMLSAINGVKDLSMTTNGILLKNYATSLAASGLHRVNVSLDTLDPQKFSYLTRNGNLDNVLKGINAAKEAGLFPIKINCVIEKSTAEPDARMVADYCNENGLEIRFIHQMNLDTGDFHQVVGGSGGDCKNCNRLRLTADGKVKPCLFSDDEYNVRVMGAENAIMMALHKKPWCGTFNHSGHFYNIGG